MPAITVSVLPPPVQSLAAPVYAPAAVLPQAVTSIPAISAPVLQPPRPAPTMTAPPVMNLQPPPPRRAPPTVAAPEQFPVVTTQIPPQYAPVPAQVSPMYMQQQQNLQGVVNWMPGMGMMGAQGMAWDPHGQLPALGGFGFPGHSNMMPQYGMHMGGAPGGMMHVDQNQRQNYPADGDMGVFHANDRSHKEEFFENRAGNDKRSFDANRRDRRNDLVGQERHVEEERRSRGTDKDIGSSRTDPSHEDHDRGKSARKDSREPGRDNNERESRSRNGSERIEESNDDRNRTSKRKRNGEDDTSTVRHDRDRDRESSRNVRGDRNGDRDRR